MTEPLNHPQQLWQSQPIDNAKISAAAISRRAGKFERRIRRRNLREYVSSFVAIVMFGYFFAKDTAILSRVAYILFIAGLGWVVVQLHRKGAPRSMPAAAGGSTSLQFFRAELERQRDAVRTVWSWYLAPLVPGFVFLTLAVMLSSPSSARMVRITLADGTVAALFFFVWKLNQRAARCLQRTIDELDAAEDSQ